MKQVAFLFGFFAFSCCAFSRQTAPAQPAPQQTFSVSGVIVRHDTKRPLPHVVVTLARNDHPDQQSSVKTNDDGRFFFTDVPRGKYTLSAEYRGFTKAYREDGFYSTGIATGPGIDSEHITFPMTAPSSLSVTVIDEAGEPVREAQPVLFHRRIDQGRATISVGQRQASYANGVHRYSHLEAGTYFVGVQGRPWYAQNPQMITNGARVNANSEPNANGPDLDVVYPMTYYGNVLDPEAAKAIIIREGENARIQIALHPVPALRITVNGPGFDRSSAPEGQIQASAGLMTVGPGGALANSNTSATAGEQFEMTGVAPGRYMVSLTHFSGGNTQAQNQTFESGVIDVTGNSSIDAADLSRSALSGRVVLEGGATLPAGSGLFMRNLENGQGLGTQIQNDGSLQLQGTLLPGRYEIQLASPELYAKSLVVSGGSFDAGVLQVKSGASVDLTVTAGKGTFSADGIALTDNKAAPGAIVLLIPEDPNYVGEFPRDQSDSDGTFTLPNIHPGRYRLVAIDDGRELEYHNPAVMKPYLAGLDAITFPLNGSALLRVNVQKRQP